MVRAGGISAENAGSFSKARPVPAARAGTARALGGRGPAARMRRSAGRVRPGPTRASARSASWCASSCCGPSPTWRPPSTSTCRPRCACLACSGSPARRPPLLALRPEDAPLAEAAGAGAFDARHLCDRRRYEYVLPAWVALGREATPSAGRSCPGRPLGPPGGVALSRLPGSQPHLTQVLCAAAQPGAQHPAPCCLSLRVVSATLMRARPMRAVTPAEAEAARQRLDVVLRAYQGTHNFHNFTAGVPAGNPAAKRYVLTCGCPAVVDIEARPAAPACCSPGTAPAQCLRSVPQPPPRVLMQQGDPAEVQRTALPALLSRCMGLPDSH